MSDLEARLAAALPCPNCQHRHLTMRPGMVCDWPQGPEGCPCRRTWATLSSDAKRLMEAQVDDARSLANKAAAAPGATDEGAWFTVYTLEVAMTAHDAAMTDHHPHYCDARCAAAIIQAAKEAEHDSALCPDPDCFNGRHPWSAKEAERE